MSQHRKDDRPQQHTGYVKEDDLRAGRAETQGDSRTDRRAKDRRRKECRPDQTVFQPHLLGKGWSFVRVRVFFGEDSAPQTPHRRAEERKKDDPQTPPREGQDQLLLGIHTANDTDRRAGNKLYPTQRAYGQ